MKTRYVVAASVLAGAALGVAVSWADFRHAPSPLFPGPPQRAADAQGIPKLAIDAADHDFGYVELGKSVKHAFRLTNVGTGTLTLKAGVTTCSACTIAKLSKSRLRPGETTDVVVEFSVLANKPDFRHAAYVLTNDPTRRRVELNISGKISSRYRSLPDKLAFSRVSAGVPATRELSVYCYVSDELRVSDPQFTESDTAEFFEARIDPIPGEELTELGAKSGRRVLVTLKPGLPPGPFRQTIRLTLEMGQSVEPTELEVSIEGTVASDLTIVGHGWRADTGVLTIGSVDGAKGATRRLTVLVRGDAREQVELEPMEVDPPWLRVAAGKSSKLNDSVNQIPLTVEIPPGRPPAIYMGTDQGDYARIVLGVKNQPDVKHIRMRVKFVIGKGS